MKERPILFSGEMVRAILDGRKTQTRRVVKNQLDGYGKPLHYSRIADVQCPYGQVGDRLWVRETWHKSPYGIIYKADWDRGWGDEDTKIVPLDNDAVKVYLVDKWKPSIYMPREASRITLEITGIRIERLQDISEEDAIAEGCKRFRLLSCNEFVTCSAVDNFRKLWDSINAKKHPWANNDWVWVIEFKKANSCT